MANEKTNVAVIGMGKGGAALLEMLEGDEVVKVVGVAETNPDAPGLVIAKRMGIPIHTDWKPLLKYEGLNDIIDVTGNPKIYEALLKEKPANVDIMGGPAAKMMWLLIEERKEAEEKLEEQSRFSDNLFESVANGLVLLNLKQKIIKIHRAALKLLGLKGAGTLRTVQDSPFDELIRCAVEDSLVGPLVKDHRTGPIQLDFLRVRILIIGRCRGYHPARDRSAEYIIGTVILLIVWLFLDDANDFGFESILASFKFSAVAVEDRSAGGFIAFEFLG